MDNGQTSPAIDGTTITALVVCIAILGSIIYFGLYLPWVNDVPPIVEAAPQTQEDITIDPVAQPTQTPVVITEVITVVQTVEVPRILPEPGSLSPAGRFFVIWSPAIYAGVFAIAFLALLVILIQIAWYEHQLKKVQLKEAKTERAIEEIQSTEPTPPAVVVNPYRQVEYKGISKEVVIEFLRNLPTLGFDAEKWGDMSIHLETLVQVLESNNVIIPKTDQTERQLRDDYVWNTNKLLRYYGMTTD